MSIVEDQSKTRDYLRALLSGSPGFRLVSEHASGEEAISHLPGQRAGVVLVDLSLPKVSGIEVIRGLRKEFPKLLFLVLTVHDDVERIFKALASGAHGYLLKTTPAAELLSAIADLVEGGSPMTPSIARKVIQHFHQKPSASDAGEEAGLTPREQQVLERLAEGRTNKEIGKDMGIAIDTVKVHVRRIYQKLHVSSRHEVFVKVSGR